MPEIRVMVGSHSAATQVLRDHGIDVKKGDTRHVWNAQNTVEVEGARELFDRLKAEGYTAFNIDAVSGVQAGQMESFDPQAQKMVLIPRAAGG
jgi:hypothetical protein